MNILMVLTSHAQLGDTGKATGFWLEEFAAPYYLFKDAGATVTLASPRGGQPPLDPKSDDAASQTDATRRFKNDDAAPGAAGAHVAARRRADGRLRRGVLPGRPWPLVGPGRETAPRSR